MSTIDSSRIFPEFFDQAPVLQMRDPLAEFLGAAQGGLLTYCYEDAVKLAGHSCPTVASAYLMVIRGLKALYGSEIPERGGIEVLLRKGREEGTTGVVASMATLLTGAATETGFGGMGPAGRFARRNLLSFDNPIDCTLLLRRRDTGRAVEVTAHEEAVPWPEEMKALLPLAVSGKANEEELNRFRELWQGRVRKMLVEFAEDDRLVEVRLV